MKPEAHSLYQQIPEGQEYEEISWEEFRNTGLLLFVNQFLHIFGLALQYKVEYGEGSEPKAVVVPTKTVFRGFQWELVAKAYESLQMHMQRSQARLGKEVFDGQAFLYQDLATHSHVVATSTQHAALLLRSPTEFQRDYSFVKLEEGEDFTRYQHMTDPKPEHASIKPDDVEDQAIFDENPEGYEGIVAVTATAREWAKLGIGVLCRGEYGN